MGNLKRNDTTEYVYKREPNSQTWRENLDFFGYSLFCRFYFETVFYIIKKQN